MNNVKLQNLRRDFENLKMKDIETVDCFMTQVMNVVNQLRQYGEDLPDQCVIEKMVRCFRQRSLKQWLFQLKSLKISVRCTLMS